MRKLVGLVFVVVVGVVVVNFLRTGAVPFLESRSSEERAVQELALQLREVERDIAQATRAAGVSGLDTTQQVAPAVNELDRIGRQLDELEGRLETESGRAAADRLRDRIAEVRATVE